MNIAITCPCGAILQAKPEHAGNHLTCPKCGQSVSVPARAAAPSAAPPKQKPAREHIQISGGNDDAITAVREFVGQLQAADFESNPFRDPGFEFKVSIDHVSTGNAFARYMSLSLAGRPTVTLRFSLASNGQTIAQDTITASAFFQDSRDAGFRGGAFGGSNVSFIRTNCRKLVTQIASQLAAKLHLTDGDRKLLLGALNGKAGDVPTLKWMGITAGVLALLLASIGVFAAPANEKLPAIFIGLIAGSLFGSLIGFVIARIAGLFAKFTRR